MMFPPYIAAILLFQTASVSAFVAHPKRFGLAAVTPAHTSRLHVATSRPPQQNTRRPVRSGGGGGGGGNGNSGVIRLANPHVVRKIVVVAPSRPPPRDEESGGGGRSRGPPRSAPNSGGGGGGGGPPSVGGGGGGYAGAPAPSSDAGRPARRKRGAGGRGAASPEEMQRRRASLRIQTGRKGRAAELSQRRGSLRRRDRSSRREQKEEAALERRTVQLPDTPLTVAQLADIIGEKPVSIIKFLMTDLGVMAAMTQSLDPATCTAVAEGFGKVVGGDEDEEHDDLDVEDSAISMGYVAEDDEDASLLTKRPPVVTIMGHVDHGKTSLLDAIRSTDVTAGEAGGITQHIAAYQVKHKGDKITFIDTPGHAAFTDMRERGANITDIVILVVAADDGVKEQTKDSLICARQAGVPLIVAINKCDLETADPVRVQTELTGFDVLTEDFGGEVMASQISAKTKSNLDDLMDKIMLQAEIEDLKANPERPAECIVVEANVEKGLGTVATTLVKRGTLRVGDIFVAGETYGRVRALISTTDNKRSKEVGPSTPIRVVGFEGVPAAGDALLVAPDEQTARELAESRQRIAREAASSTYQQGLMSSANLMFGATQETREMCVVVKADVQGSAEALTRALRELRLENDEAIVTIKVLVSETGEVSKSDIAIAGVTPGTTVIAFNVAASMAAMDDARTNGISIEYYSIIYDAIESIESRMQEVLSPTPDGEYAGTAVVQEVFSIGGVGNIAGSKCTDGLLKKGSNVRVLRGDKILTESKIKTLRNFKSETDTIESGNECGIGLLDYEQFAPGDVIECFVE